MALMPAPLHVYRYGPAGPARVLALHGLTGHGRRWEHLANGFLPDVPVLAPDLIGFGRSDKPLDRGQLAQWQQARVPQQPYVYGTLPHPESAQ